MADWLTDLWRALREEVEKLREEIPVSLAAVAEIHGTQRVEVLAHESKEAVQERLSGQPPVAAMAFDWVEVNRRTLVLDRGGRDMRSDLYRPLRALGMESAMVTPLLVHDRVAAVLVVAGRHIGGYTRTEVRRVQSVAKRLSGILRRRDEEPEGLRGQSHSTSEFPTPSVPRSVNETVPTTARKGDSSPDQAEGGFHAEAGMSVSGLPAGETTIQADELGRVTQWNEEARRIFGWQEQEVVGRFLTLIVEDREGRVLEINLGEKLTAKGPFCGRAVSWRSDGKAVLCHLDLHQVRSGGSSAVIMGHVRVISSARPAAREPVQLTFAQLYSFGNPLA